MPFTNARTVPLVVDATRASDVGEFANRMSPAVKLDMPVPPPATVRVPLSAGAKVTEFAVVVIASVEVSPLNTEDEVANAIDAAVVVDHPVPIPVTFPFPEPPTQMPFTAKHPDARLKPFAMVDVPLPVIFNAVV